MKYCTKPVTRYKQTKLWRGPLIAARWLTKKDGFGASGGLEAGAFYSTNDKVEHPDAQIHLIPVAMPLNIDLTFPYGESYNVSIISFCIFVCGMKKEQGCRHRGSRGAMAPTFLLTCEVFTNHGESSYVTKYVASPYIMSCRWP